MVKRLLPGWKSLAVPCAMLMILAGCARSQPSKFYVLNAQASPGARGSETVVASGLSIGVGPVKVPDYLDRVQIVTRTTSNTLELAEFDRWAEPLDQSLPRILAEDLRLLFPDDNVSVFPWPSSTRVDYQVVVEVIQFDAILGQRAWLEARWTILTEAGKQVLLRRNTSISEPAGGPSHEVLVSAWSKALAGLSHEIASSIRSAVEKVPEGALTAPPPESRPR